MTRSLAIYFFYDKDGVVDDYVFFYLNSLLEVFTDVCFVSNGPLNDTYISKLKNVTTKIIIRSNAGFDSWAYKEAIESYGYGYIATLDKLLLNNFTCYGPIYPFAEMFSKMERVECDFWGHCLHTSNVTSMINGHIVYPHLMSYFICFKNKILSDISFKTYWDTLPPIESYQDAVVYHEIRCTRFFEKKGFISASFINPQNYHEQSTGNIVVFNALSLLIVDKSPLLKRKIFELNEHNKFKWPLVTKNKELYIFDYISEYTNYPKDLIISNLKRTYFKNNINLVKKASK